MAGADWRRQAKCLGMDPNLFVPSGPGGSLKKVYAICNGSNYEEPCPVRVECEEFAKANDLVGVFGGKMHSQRRISRRLDVVVEVQSVSTRPINEIRRTG